MGAVLSLAQGVPLGVANFTSILERGTEHGRSSSESGWSSSEIGESARGQIFVRPDRAPVGVVGFRVKCEIGKLRAW